MPVPAAALGPPFWLSPDTMSSMRRSIAADSTAVLMLCTLTAYASQTPSSFMSTMVPLSPSMPKVQALPPVLSAVHSACLALSFVREGRWETAKKLYERALELDPDQHRIRAPFGWCLYYLGELEASRRQFDSFLAIEPDDPAAVYAVAMISIDEIGRAHV